MPLDSSSAGAMHRQQLRTCAGRRGVTLAAWSAVCVAASCRLACMAHQHLAQGELRLASLRCAQLVLAAALVSVGRHWIRSLAACRAAQLLEARAAGSHEARQRLSGACALSDGQQPLRVRPSPSPPEKARFFRDVRCAQAVSFLAAFRCTLRKASLTIDMGSLALRPGSMPSFSNTTCKNSPPVRGLLACNALRLALNVRTGGGAVRWLCAGSACMHAKAGAEAGCLPWEARQHEAEQAEQAGRARAGRVWG